MKGTEKIIAHIQADADAQADAILAQAEHQCAGIRQKYEDKAREVYAEKIRAGVKANQDRLESMERLAKMEGRKAVLALKQESVSDAFRRALELIAELPEDKYVDFLARSAAKAAVTGREELVFNERDRASVAAKACDAANALLKERGLPGGLTVSSDTRPVTGGLIVRSGDIETNCSVETAAAALRDELASQLAGTMFS